VKRVIPLVFPPLHPAQREVVGAAKRFNILRCGRRWGKTTLLLRLAAQAAAERGQAVGWFAPIYSLLAPAYEELLRRTRPGVVRAAERPQPVIRYVSGGRIEFWSLDSRDVPGRGRAYDLAIIDEAAFAPSLARVWEEAILPTLLDRLGSAWIASTPKGRNAFYELWNLTLDDPAWAHFHEPSHRNPFLSQEELARMAATMTRERYRQEILAEWVDAEGRVFSEDALEAALLLQGPEDPRPGERYAAGVDLARSQDYTAVAVLRLGAQLELVRVERWRGLSYTLTARKVAALLARYEAYAHVDATGVGDAAWEGIRAEWPRVRPIRITGGRDDGRDTRSKENLVGRLQSALETQELLLYPHPELLGELRAFEARPLPSGGYAYSAPEGLHDDLVMALALALDAARASRGTGQVLKVPGRWSGLRGGV
jgi:phage FluMu gp28-like protein